MYTYRKAKNRASAYLLVVSVVAILALIGSVFLMSTIDDRRESDARRESVPVRTVATQVVDMIQAALVDDLAIGDYGPYSESDGMSSYGQVPWRAYIDYASPNPDDTYDAFLASTERALAPVQIIDSINEYSPVKVDAGCWPKVSNIYGYEGALVTNVNPAWEYIPTRFQSPHYTAHMPIEYYFGRYDDPSTTDDERLLYIDTPLLERIQNSGTTNLSLSDGHPFGDPNSLTPDCIPLIDTDGDNVRDALLFPTGSYSGDGKQYYAAVRIVDTSAFVNVNVSMNNAGNGESFGREIDGVDSLLTVGMIDPSHLPLSWPNINDHGPSQLTAGTPRENGWAFRDISSLGSPSHPNCEWDAGGSETYAPSYGWPERNYALNPSYIRGALDYGLPRTGWPASSLPGVMADTFGRQTQWISSGAQSYLSYYDKYVRRMTNPDASSGADFYPFDITDEFACRWMDSATWENTDTYDIEFDTIDNSIDQAVELSANKLRSSRIYRVLDDYIQSETVNSAFTDAFQTRGGKQIEKWQDWAYISRQLTTVSASRELARYRPMHVSNPAISLQGLTGSNFNDGDADGSRNDDEVEEWPSLSVKVDLNLPLGTNSEKMYAFNQYRIAFAWSLGLDIEMNASEREKIYRRAAELALRLIDFRDKDTEISCVDLNDTGIDSSNGWYNPGRGCLGTGTSTLVFGMEPMPVISHIWTKLKVDDDYDTVSAMAGTDGFLDLNDTREFYTLVAIYNPYPVAIDISDWQFEMDSAQDFTSGTIIGPGEYVVVRATSTNNPPPATPPAPSNINITSNAYIADVVDMAGVNVDPDSEVFLRAKYVMLAPGAPAPAAGDYKEVSHFKYDTITTQSVIGVHSGYSGIDGLGGDYRLPLEYYNVEINASSISAPPGGPLEIYTLFARQMYDIDTATGAFLRSELGERTPFFEMYQENSAHDRLQDYTGADDFDPVLTAANLTTCPTAENLDYQHTTSGTDMPHVPVFIRGYDDSEPDAKMLSVAELGRLFYFDDILAYDNCEENEIISRNTGGSIAQDDINKLYFNAEDFINMQGNAYDPKMPAYCRLTNYFTVNSPLLDGVDNDGDGVTDPAAAWTAEVMRELTLPGRINVNTATVATLCTLPMLVDDDEDDRLEFADNIIAYRDLQEEEIESTGDESDPANDLPDFYDSGNGFNDVNRDILGGADFRDEPGQFGIASTGELAAYLRYIYADKFWYDTGHDNEYIDDSPAGHVHGPAYGAAPDDTDDSYTAESVVTVGGVNFQAGPTQDITKYDMRWNYLSNLLTVNSDVFCAYIWVQEGSELHAEGRRYVVVLDRSNCVRKTDKPIIKGFIELPKY